MPVIDEITSDVKAAYDSLEQFDRDNRYIDVHYDDLYKEHRNQWIAVHKEDVVAVAADIAALRTAVEQKGLLLEDIARRKLVRVIDKMI